MVLREWVTATSFPFTLLIWHGPVPCSWDTSQSLLTYGMINFFTVPMTNLLVLCRHEWRSSAFYLVMQGSDRKLGHSEIKVKFIWQFIASNSRDLRCCSRGMPLFQVITCSVSGDFSCSWESKAFLQITTWSTSHEDLKIIGRMGTGRQ